MWPLMSWNIAALLILFGCRSIADEVVINKAMVEEAQADILTLSMPSDLNMTINMIAGTETLPVNLSLHMNKGLNEHRSVYVLRLNKDGKQVLIKEDIPIEGNVAFYQDKTAGAAVKVVCEGLNTGHCDPTLHGSFYMNNVEYGLEPLPDEPHLRHKRNAKTKRKARAYSVFRVKRAQPSEYDFQPSGSGNGSAMQFLQREIDTNKLNFPEPGMAMSRRTSSMSTRRRSKLRKHYKMGVIVIVDFGIYEKWYRMSNKTTALDKDVETKFKIREYMAHVINGIDLRYKTLSNFEIDVVVTQYIIADSPSASPWTSRRFSSEPRDLVFADHALNELARWRYFMDHKLPKHDHTMLFTGYDLYRPTLANTGVAGFARVQSMCSPMSVSVVEEHGGFSSILTATHELGHSLGAYHDGHNNSCDGQDNFIMTPIGGGTSTPSNSLNPFRFSTCSEDAFENFLQSLPPNNCLTDNAEIYDKQDFNDHLQETAGQLYGPNEQCIQHLGSVSYYAWGGILGESEDVCTHMACKNHQSNTSFNIYYAVRGTSCGNKRWCNEGVCTYSDLAPSRDDNCVHGDSWRRFGNMSCAEYVNEDPSRCYYSFYSRFCCVSCQKLRRNVAGCEYGNRKRICTLVNSQPRFCYHDNNEKMCCGSCEKHHTGVKGCEYGDRSMKCDPSRCTSRKYVKKCCKTCAFLNKPLKNRRPTPEPKRQLIVVVPTRKQNLNHNSFGLKPTNNDVLANLKPKVRPTKPVRKIPSLRKNLESRFRSQNSIVSENLKHKHNKKQDSDIRSNLIEQNIQPQSKVVIKQLPTAPQNVLLDQTTQMCVKVDAKYFMLSCSWIARWMKSLCSQPILGAWCCERCIASRSREAVCIDRIGCTAKSGVECYNKEERERCCSTCRNFQTGIPDCPYGNRGKHCDLFMRFIPQQTCRVLKDNCCFSCRSFHQNNSFTENNFHQINNNNFQNSGTRKIFDRRSRRNSNREQFETLRHDPLVRNNRISNTRSLQRRLGGGRNLIRWS